MTTELPAAQSPTPLNIAPPGEPLPTPESPQPIDSEFDFATADWNDNSIVIPPPLRTREAGQRPQTVRGTESIQGYKIPVGYWQNPKHPTMRHRVNAVFTHQRSAFKFIAESCDENGETHQDPETTRRISPPVGGRTFNQVVLTKLFAGLSLAQLKIRVRAAIVYKLRKGEVVERIK